MSEKPQKRLVEQKEYLKLQGAKGANYSLAVVFACGGLWGLLGGTVLFFSSFYLLLNPHEPGSEALFQFLSISVLVIGCSIAALWGSKSLYDKGKKIESVTPITRHNTVHLPAVETLVRASDAPASQQTELLRAAQYGKETPAEELLRAGQESREDM